MQFGRYETLRPIASGGMATVHLGRAVGAGGFERLVAIKVLHPHIAAEPDFVAMFLDEARLAARVRHPNVVATIDVEEDPLFLVMEYIEGPSLQTVLREKRKTGAKLPLDVTLKVFLDVLAGLHDAHDLMGPEGEPLHLVHRDVSPHNLLLGVDGVSRITDFGVARAASRLSSTRGGQIKGKLAYMAPEQIGGGDIDRRVDVYAAGAVLFEILTGDILFKADNEGALIQKIIAGAKESPSQIDPMIPVGLSDVCMKALQRRTDARYPTAAAMADAIEDVARRAGLTIASSRAVAAFVKGLALHEGVPIAPSSASGSRRVPLPPSSSSGARVLPEPTEPTDSKGSTSNVSTILEPVSITQARPRRSWPIVLGAVAVLAVVATAVLMLTRGSSAHSPSTAAAASASPMTPASVPPEATTASPPASATAASAPASSSDTPSTAAATSSSPPATAASATSGRPLPSGTPVQNRPTTSPTSFRPDSL